MHMSYMSWVAGESQGKLFESIAYVTGESRVSCGSNWEFIISLISNIIWIESIIYIIDQIEDCNESSLHH